MPSGHIVEVDGMDSLHYHAESYDNSLLSSTLIIAWFVWVRIIVALHLIAVGFYCYFFFKKKIKCRVLLLIDGRSYIYIYMSSMTWLAFKKEVNILPIY